MATVRVLQINAGSQNFGGVSALIVNIYKHIDTEKVNFDFLTPNRTTYEMVRPEIEKLGGKIYDMGIDNTTFRGKILLYRALGEFLKEHHYDVIHVNSGVLMFNYVVACACKRFSNAKVFIHSHGNGTRKKWQQCISVYVKSQTARKADLHMACSKSAAVHMFPRKIAENSTVIIKNGIETDMYAYNPEVRERVRRELKLEDRFVIGHVGRFTLAKNHEFILKVFSELRKTRSDAVLMLIGQGELEKEIRQLADSLGITDSILFMGQRSDAENLYQAMDVFFLPSRNEGFGIVNLEAQAAGLPCVVSTKVPDTVNVTGMVEYLDLDAPISEWIEKLVKDWGERTSHADEIKKAGYDITACSAEMQDYYLKYAGMKKQAAN